MEYCGAGSVSDIIRLRNKTVSLLKKCITLIKIKLWIKTGSQNKSQSFETGSWLMPRGVSVPWFPRKQGRAVALIICCPFLCGVIISQRKWILKYEDPVNFLKITALYKAKLCAFFPLPLPPQSLSAGHLVPVWFENRHRIVLISFSN